MNGLTTQAGLKIGPIVLETLVKHYFERLKLNFRAQADNPQATQLRQDELLYDEAFNIVKAFLNAASHHTVEEVQAFANTRTPSPPWVHVVRLVVPMSCCDEAAQHLITALGGEDAARKIVGGCKWWQVRGIAGVDAQWITAKKDWQEAKRRDKMQKSKSPSPTPVDSTDSAPYEKHMDEMRCILYAHGGGYYFGSVDQERYSIQRHARKINGRVFAINYRLSPQYPFPCALQDLIAAYLYLIKPPAGASHRPVNPAHVVVAGDSAGGGLTLALLQVLRDTGLPLPAGGVLVSPWCDLTHSFPSIHINTATDVIPDYGLSFQKPSSLWPPPSEDMSSRVHASLRTWIRNTFNHADHSRPATPAPIAVPDARVGVDVGATAPVPHDNELITLTLPSGEELRIDRQVHLYAKNSLLAHPLVSTALSYLGGLPPLLIIASDKEVLRDEIIYTAHKAANPEKYPLKDDIRAMYPSLRGIESKFGSTKVHLQVYDDTAHVLPVLFSFTTPGKFCYRAIASFSRHVTGMPQRQGNDSRSDGVDFSMLPPLPPSPSEPTFGETPSVPRGPTESAARQTKSAFISRRLSMFKTPPLKMETTCSQSTAEGAPNPSDHRRSTSFFSHFGGSYFSTVTAPSTSGNESTPGDVAGPRFAHGLVKTPQPMDEERMAGDPAVYTGAEWTEGSGMVRERVSTRGVIRPLEPEADLVAFSVAPEQIGIVSELAVRRYLQGTQRWDSKFANTLKTVEKHRRRNLKRAQKDTLRNMSMLQNFIGREAGGQAKDDSSTDTFMGVKDGLLAISGSWNWAWALDANENPPPSSIVSRRDTREALRLARIADQPLMQEHAMTANNLWSVMVNFLTVAPDKGKDKGTSNKGGEGEAKLATTLTKKKSAFLGIFPPKEKEVV